MNHAARYYTICPQGLKIKDVRDVLAQGLLLRLGDEAAEKIQGSRHFLEQKLSQTERPIYGINTGFGSLCDLRISDREMEQLQLNLVRSHACGMGEEIPSDLVRLMLLLKIQSLAEGHSGVRLQLVEQLIALFNHGALPVVYEQGSLGASGDLAPLAHLSLPLIGEGEVRYKGRRRPSAEVLSEIGISPLKLASKEGLALLNGTQFSTAYALWCVIKGEELLEWANCCAALSMDAFRCLYSPLEAPLQRIRKQEGQAACAQSIREYLRESEIGKQPKTQVQDPYAFRCVPQVHGASWGVLQHLRQIVQNEMLSVTDNPSIFPEEDKILSGGNFHAQPIALALDYLGLALAELGSISERRLFQLLSGQRGLPPFLISKPGLNSGFMIVQYTAASIASQNKQLCTPASVDSIVSSNGQEDHVSMAANAGTKTLRILNNLRRLLSLELMAASQALYFRLPANTGKRLRPLLKAFQKHIPPLTEDRILAQDMQRAEQFLAKEKP